MMRMISIRTYYHTGSNGIRLLLMVLFLCTGLVTSAQINIRGKVFGGARQADVGGSTFVDIGADHNHVIINAVYGGNDISGQIGALETKKPAGFTPQINTIDNSFQAFVHVSLSTNKIFIGKLFGGGDGSYDYTSQKLSDNTTPNPYYGMSSPILSKTYLQINGGTFVQLFGGGNNATVTGNTTICIDNTSTVVKSILEDEDDENSELLTIDRLKEMGVNTSQTDIEGDFQFGRVFGGNNFADMAIRPTWYLKKGKIRDLYSGGNEGRMTSPEGLLLQIDAEYPNALPTDAGVLWINNVYGGCRKADVRPEYSPGNYVPIASIKLPDSENAGQVPPGYSARIRILGGYINNVYGGNDISGTVYGGNTIGIFTTIHGNVYGGGNGSYPYTDNPLLEGDEKWGDYYYDVNKFKNRSKGSDFTQAESVEALNAFRPNAERVSIRVSGTAGKTTFVEGALYAGGNSATLEKKSADIAKPTAELKIGSYVTIDQVFLGNNGENMVDSHLTKNENGDTLSIGVLRTLRSTNKTSNSSQYNSINLKDETLFAEYMKGCAMMIDPDVVFDDGSNSPDIYVPYTTQFGSFYCGGNVGSIIKDGLISIPFDHEVIIYDKLVGGCNNANVAATDYNAAYEGGLLGNFATPETGKTIGNKLELNLSNLKVQPKRWKKNADGSLYVNPTTKLPELEFNTISASTGEDVDPVTEQDWTGEYKESTATDVDRRFKGGNIYGGCYNSGHVNGNVVINLNSSVVDRKGEYAIFDKIEEVEGEANLYNNNNDFKILERRSGVILDEQGMDVLGKALNVFGGGYGPESEIWGSTIINLKAGYTFQIFGGGEKGPIGKPDDGDGTAYEFKYNVNGVEKTRTYKYNPNYSCIINVRGEYPGTFRGDADDSDGAADNTDMAEAEFIYGGSFEAPIAGNTQINLGNGRIFNSFAGSCNADILGHTETYVGRNTSAGDAGFPWVRDHIYGANDLGGKIHQEASFLNNISTNIKNLVYNPNSEEVPDVVKASAYIEYTQGRVDYIYGGCYGVYDYTDPYFKDYTYTIGGVGTITEGEDKNLGMARPGFSKPSMGNAFINFKPNTNGRNVVSKIFGAGQGYKDEKEMNLMQLSSYVLIDAPDNDNFKDMEVFGAGSYGGLGMSVNKATAAADLDNVSAVIDLIRGKIANVYGGSWNEGFTRRTVVNVPEGSTVNVNSLFGGAYGSDPLIPCDVYEAKVNYHSENATVRGNIYGGNNHADRTLYGQVNVTVPVWQNKADGYLATVYGAGYGKDSWSQYTEVNLTGRAQVLYVYGGGENGQVLNLETINKWKSVDPTLDLTLGSDYVDYGLNFPDGDKDAYLVKANGLGTKTNTNVYIGKGALIGYITFNGDQKNIFGGYAFGGGYGADAIVSGTTYVGLHGGEVGKDIYGGGYGGSVLDSRGVAKDNDTDNDFIAGTNAYIEGGTLRKVFGGGYEGHVGKHTGEEIEGKFVAVAGNVLDDIPGETNVVIGIRKDQEFPDGFTFAEGSDSLNYYKGVPAIQWNAYGAGEGGSVFGTSHVTLNNGYIGYDYKGIDNNNFEVYEPKLNNETVAGTAGIGQLKDYGSLFGAGYDDKSSSDFTDIKLYGGVIRGSLYGGGEISTVGRGKAENSTGLDRKVTDIFLTGGTHIEMYNGHVQRHIFGGGKGYNLEGYGGSHELYTDGYVFGKTEVYIHGGTVGTLEGLDPELNYGNVFGGGDVGFVYGTGYFDQYTKDEKTNNPKGSTGSPDHWYYYGSYKCSTAYGPYKVGDVISNVAYNSMSTDEKAHWAAGKYLTEDCKVIIAPYLQKRTDGVEQIGNHNYDKYDYVTTEDLNKLAKTKNEATGVWSGSWQKLFTGDRLANGDVNPDDPVERGIRIYNAVFAGGNVSSNSDQTYTNAKTVFGNTTATLFDVYHRDFITVGTEHIGGLYGGGNLSLVEGYRELNITNYGTDYYGLDSQITLAKYRTLSNRERAYFQLEYLCQETHNYNGKTYTANESRITEEEYNAIPDDTEEGRAERARWQQYGFCSIYAGRLLNTIQRADLCGVFGSRLVLQGAKDRVATEDNEDNASTATVYTINRIGELSLNKQNSIISSDTGDDAEHGNYFGIYSVVNYLGHLTSDVKFTDPYLKWNKETKKAEAVDGTTYYSWKTSRLKYRDRNNGTCHNQVALASGVFLEVTTEYSTKSKKDYGDITGIVELDLINVKKDIEGGGYVYARNEHGTRTEHAEYPNIILSSYNMKNVAAGREEEARTYKRYTYDDGKTDATKILDHETSGNFIHKTKRIVDDCYPHNGVYNDGYNESPAHYWFIKGEVYIYDRDVTAYAGSATAYSKNVDLPLTITAASEGKLKLLNVQPNLYAYYADEAQETKIGTDGVKVNNESETYHLNDVISWWDWNQLPANEQKYFVETTYVNVDDCTINGTPYTAGSYVSVTKPTASTFDTVLDKNGENMNTADGIQYLFRSSNNISHETGYILTFDMDSPTEWDDWYSKLLDTTTGDAKITKEVYNNGSIVQANYIEGPTYRLKAGQSGGLYGQRDYAKGDIISKEVYDDYTTTVGTAHFDDQAEVERAYVAKESYGNITAGYPISTTDYGKLSTDVQSKYEKAMVCTNTIQLGENEFILLGELVPVDETDANETELKAIAAKYKKYNNSKQNADPVTDEEALEYVKARLSDAYYCTTAGKYGGQLYKAGQNYSAIKSWCSLSDEDRNKFDFNYDAFDVLSDSSYPGEDHTNVYRTPYSDTKPVEYSAVYSGTTLPYEYYDNNNTKHTIPAEATTAQRTISRLEFENIKNEQRDYTPINVPAGNDTYTAYIAKATFIDGGVPIAEGEDVTDRYNSLSAAAKENVTSLNISKTSAARTVYYNYKDNTATAPIEAPVFRALTNYQKEFVIQGKEPTGTITLYVSGQSQPKDVLSEKIITVVYQYTYFESDEESEGSTLVNELHVLNIHLKLESGVPEIGPLSTPPTVLPGSTVGLKTPSVKLGLYEPLSNGWEMFHSEMDAEMKRNGEPFSNNGTRLYWYQNQKVWVAYYSRTVLGKTYSNPVLISVANYHDLSDVMADKDHHMYVDHTSASTVRAPKIYLDQTKHEDENQLDLLKSLYDLSTGASITEHTPLNTTQVGNCKNLEFILRSNLDHTGSWSGIGASDDDHKCFEGTLHGDGYTISGLDHSLFNRLCGDVYNLGVRGSFTGAGVAETGSGYVENCWISTDSTLTKTSRPIFGTPTGIDTTRPYRIVNCYYQEAKGATKPYTNHNGSYGIPIPMDSTAFYNGTVAYNLNSSYLNKRYYDKQYAGVDNPTTDSDYYPYYYLPVDKSKTDNSLVENLVVGYYPKLNESGVSPCAQYGDIGYVESRYDNEDFIYADGTIPDAIDIHQRTVTVEGNPEIRYAPIWPDDYLFFGQTLNYGYGTQTHDAHPTHLAKVNGRLPQSESSNRVYRAPAYFRSKNMDVAHFNPQAYLAAYSAAESISNPNLKPAYPGMTAIDFAGHQEGTGIGAFKQGYNGKLFYQPLLDDDGLIGVSNNGETQNLLVYAPSDDVNQKTNTVLNAYFVPNEPTFAFNTTAMFTSDVSPENYNRVAAVNTGEIVGHLVQSSKTTITDHLLVDKQDFNCPIAYTIGKNKRMWYQRQPSNYVMMESGKSKGWEDISLPFSAELVTTQTKGEITHFYKNSTKGHEYWLRELTNIQNGNPDDLGIFTYPQTGTEDKVYTNSFLWDYYYSQSDFDDANADKYQQNYYKYDTSKEYVQKYEGYPRSVADKPYLIGFPSAYYYEFDLSGGTSGFKPENTATDINRLEKQVITFASKPSVDGSLVTIGVSDDEIEMNMEEYNGYLYCANYISKDMAAGSYLLSAAGNKYEKLTATTKMVPFRPYFIKKPSPTRTDGDTARSIIFSDEDSRMDMNTDIQTFGMDGDIIAKGSKKKITVVSQMPYTIDVRIVTPAGMTLTSFSLEPSEEVVTRVENGGVYIVDGEDGRHVKKVIVR